MGSLVLLGQLVLILAIRGCQGDATYVICAYRDTDPPKSALRMRSSSNRGSLSGNDLEGGQGTIMPDNVTMRCPLKNDRCYSLWQADPTDKTKITIIKQGCWGHSGSATTCNGEPECLSNDPPGTNARFNNTKFCCCMGSMCNLNVSDVYVPGLLTTANPAASPETHILPDPNYKEKTIIIALASVCSVAVVLIVLYLVFRLWLGSPKRSLDNASLTEAPPDPSSNLEHLKLSGFIDKGRFGELWKGTLDDQDVAVKVFNLSQKQYFHNEKDIYSLPFMDHPSLPKFYGTEERVLPEGISQFFLVMSYVHLGNLHQYLKNNTIDWPTLCRMCHTTASGLAHLHSDISKGGKFKPAIAHRDFNTRNLLVRADLACVVCDFGFAMKIMGSRFIRNGQEENAEQSSLTDVGTLRYMAPEVLDGAVNLRDCEASLKQIDVYALGLVMWEIATQCSDLYQGLPVPEYQLPYQAEVGSHPSFEEMQLLVSRNKVRPAMPDIWKDTNQAIRALKETLEDCWDQDAEARLTAMCVQERVLEMSSLWDSRHRSVTPTVNAMYHVGGSSDKNLLQRNLRESNSSDQGSENTGSSGHDRNGNVTQPLLSTENDDQLSELSPAPPSSRVSRSSVSASTTETTLTTSPSESAEPFTNKANRNLTYAKANRVLQPHQGQNPTVERNTHKRSDEELAVLGNTLVEKSVAQHAQEEKEKQRRLGSTTSGTFSDEIFDAIADNLESSLVQNDILSHQQRVHPVRSRVHNQVNSRDSMVVRPKQPNVASDSKASAARPGSRESQGHKGRWGKNKKSKENKGKFSFSLFGKKSGNYDKAYVNDKDNSKCSASALLPKSQSAKRQSSHNVYTSADKSNLAPRPVPTEVRMVNGAPVVRPKTLAVDSPSGRRRSKQNSVARPSNPRLGNAEVGIAKLETTANGVPTIMKVRRKSRSNDDVRVVKALSPDIYDDDVFAPDGYKVQRPSTLPVNGHNYTQYSATLPSSVKFKETKHKDENLNRNNNKGKIHKDPHIANNICQNIEKLAQKKDNKESGNTKNARLSLYDDRIMSQSSGDFSVPHKVEDSVNKSSISLRQFGSTDGDMTTLRAADFRC